MIPGSTLEDRVLSICLEVRLRRRRRNLPTPMGRGHTVVRNYLRPGHEAETPPSDNSDTYFDLGTIQGSQITDSEDHHWPPPPGELNDVGGEFFTQRSYVVGNPINVSASSTTIVNASIARDVTYVGPIWPVSGSYMQFPNPIRSSDAQLYKLGATAVANCKPTNAVINLATFLSEVLREGLPRVPFKDWEVGTKTTLDTKVRGGADEYLNWQFGWKPVINDIEAVAAQIANAERVIAQYERDAGRVVRRRWELPEKQSYSSTQYLELASGWYGPKHTDLVRSGRSYQLKVEDFTSEKTWFSGAFTYHLPSDWKGRKEMSSANARLQDLFDLELTPEAVWNATPWTWAVDWFANTGDVLSNITSWAKDGLVMRYGYIMQHCVAERVYTLLEPRPLQGAGGSNLPSARLITETKTRKRANPYGFGVSWDSLSATQQAILAALGITRTRR